MNTWLENEQKEMWLRNQNSIFKERAELIASGYSAKQANQMLLEMLRVKGSELKWREGC